MIAGRRWPSRATNSTGLSGAISCDRLHQREGFVAVGDAIDDELAGAAFRQADGWGCRLMEFTFSECHGPARRQDLLQDGTVDIAAEPDVRR